jgi:hypothetical protein
VVDSYTNHRFGIARNDQLESAVEVEVQANQTTEFPLTVIMHNIYPRGSLSKVSNDDQLRIDTMKNN